MYGKQPPPQTDYLFPPGNKLMSENMGSGAIIIKGIGPEVESINLPGRRLSNPTSSSMVVPMILFSSILKILRIFHPLIVVFLLLLLSPSSLALFPFFTPNLFSF